MLKIKREELIIALIISVALIVAILSLPEILLPIAKYILESLGAYWFVAIGLIGMIHGLKPDEHTWPITISYGLMQRKLKGALLSTAVFAGALTVVWTALSALTGDVFSFFTSNNLDTYVDIIVGVTMISVALALLIHRKEDKKEKTADYKVIWVHGLAAAFGGDFIVVLILTVATVTFLPSMFSFLVGLLFGLGSWIAQSLVVALTYKGVVRVVQDTSIMIRAGRLSLLFLGAFMIMLGLFAS